jgi:hypothetical protein
MGALLSAAVGFLVRSVLVKFLLFTAMYFIVSAVCGYLVSKLPGPSDLNSALASWSPAMWFFADLTMWTQFFPAVISAYILRFAIRRIPFFG